MESFTPILCSNCLEAISSKGTLCKYGKKALALSVINAWEGLTRIIFVLSSPDAGTGMQGVILRMSTFPPAFLFKNSKHFAMISINPTSSIIIIAGNVSKSLGSALPVSEMVMRC